jgi:predicted outer membrane repeat protein
MSATASISNNHSVNDGGGIHWGANVCGSITGVTAASVRNNSPNNCGSNLLAEPNP